MAEIRRQRLGEAVRARAIDVLVVNSAHYPQEAVRDAAADATREIAARHLRDASGPELDHLLEALRRLVPADRLLERDTSRLFSRSHAAAATDGGFNGNGVRSPKTRPN